MSLIAPRPERRFAVNEPQHLITADSFSVAVMRGDLAKGTRYGGGVDIIVANKPYDDGGNHSLADSLERDKRPKITEKDAETTVILTLLDEHHHWFVAELVKRFGGIHLGTKVLTTSATLN